LEGVDVRSAQESFTTDDAAPADRQDRWEEILTTTHLPLRVGLSRTPSEFRASVDRRWFDDVALIELECGPCHGERGPALVAGDDDASIGIFFAACGEERLAVDDEQLLVRAGDFVVWDTTRKLRFDIPDGFHKRTLLFPRAALEEVSGRSWASMQLVLDAAAPSVRLLRSYLETLLTLAAELPAQSVLAARNAALELVAGTVRPGLSDATALAGEALKAAVMRWVDRNLGAGPVCPETAAAAHAVSVRTLHRSFAAVEMTFGGAVRIRRLSRARADLVTTLDSVQAIAHRWGFADASHFCRTFKGHYGMSPNDYRAIAGQVRSSFDVSDGELATITCAQRGTAGQMSGTPIQ
jgi:AraC family transcriptional activator of tynA and feaB